MTGPEPMPATAREALRLALLDLDGRRELTPCQGRRSHRWTSDNAEERSWAAYHCRGCVVLELCAEAADEGDERWFVFGGRDRTRKSPTRQTG